VLGKGWWRGLMERVDGEVLIGIFVGWEGRGAVEV